jgi:hypothetical protein
VKVAHASNSVKKGKDDTKDSDDDNSIDELVSIILLNKTDSFVSIV